ncbi:hypothetical protein E4U57_000854 [Claviceps arundinis]|uniref:Uncharacterized protein n=1 Tax=Claviceps arundinis TaxID=1623583 RepID=A0ABQ7PC28_9HYPO|nr:hypothetical protein E4U57_000854 [Claviceps arundinis]
MNILNTYAGVHFAELAAEIYTHEIFNTNSRGAASTLLKRKRSRDDERFSYRAPNDTS